VDRLRYVLVLERTTVLVYIVTQSIYITMDVAFVQR